jgi:hypothetical protein
MRTRSRTRGALVATATLAALAVISGTVAASANSRPAELQLVSRSTPSIVVPSTAATSTPATQTALRFQTQVATELAHLDLLRHDASPASPARFRIQEQTDALNEQAVTIDQLVRVLQVHDQANPGSTAQFRAWESATDLATRLRSLHPDNGLVGV